MTSPRSIRRTPARIALVTGLVVAAIGLIVLILTGVPGFPLIPPGPIILLGAAGLVAFLPWRWSPVIGLAAAVFLTGGAVLAGVTRELLATPSDVGPFLGAVIQVVGLAVALVAGVLAVVHPAESRARVGAAAAR